MESKGSVIERMKAAYPSLSPTFRKIADYLITHYRDAAFMSAARLAAEVGVSESMVVRFAYELGFSGYGQLVEDVQAYVKQWLLPSERLRSAAPLDQLDLVSLRNAILEQDALNLRVTANDYANRAFSQAASLLSRARLVYVIGLHGMAHLAHLFGYLLAETGTETEVIAHGDSYLFSKLRRSGPEDVLVAFAYSRYTQRTLDAVALAKERGAKVLTITDALTSPPATLSDVVIRAAVSSGSVMASHVSGVAVVYALAKAYGAHVSERYGAGTGWHVPESEICLTRGETGSS